MYPFESSLCKFLYCVDTLLVSPLPPRNIPVDYGHDKWLRPLHPSTESRKVDRLPGNLILDTPCVTRLVDDLWYKIMGPIHGPCFINPSGPPTCTEEETLDNGGVGLVAPPIPLTPVAPGQFIPPEPWWISIGWGV